MWSANPRSILLPCTCIKVFVSHTNVQPCDCSASSRSRLMPCPHSRKATHPHIPFTSSHPQIYHSIFNHHCPQSSEKQVSITVFYISTPVQKLADDCKYRLTVDWEVVSHPSQQQFGRMPKLSNFAQSWLPNAYEWLSFFLEASWTMAIGASKIESGLAVVDFLRGYIMIGSKYPGLFASIRGQVLDYTVSCLRQASHGTSKSLCLCYFFAACLQVIASPYTNPYLPLL